jgi:hypothetical protein
MSIKGSIQLVITQILLEKQTTGGKSETSDKVHDRSVAAIIAGQRTPAGDITPQWREYMNFLLTATGTTADPDELARLLPTDGTNTGSPKDIARQGERAYLVANGMCGSTTTDTLLDGNVTNALDPVP